MKKIFKTLGINFCAAAIPLGISLLINGYGSVDEQQRSMLIVLLCGALISIGGYRYLTNRRGIVMTILGAVVLGIALFTLPF